MLPAQFSRSKWNRARQIWQGREEREEEEEEEDEEEEEEEEEKWEGEREEKGRRKEERSSHCVTGGHRGDTSAMAVVPRADRWAKPSPLRQRTGKKEKKEKQAVQGASSCEEPVCTDRTELLVRLRDCISA